MADPLPHKTCQVSKVIYLGLSLEKVLGPIPNPRI